MASSDENRLEGGHRKNLLYVIEEAKGFTRSEYASVMGAMTQEGNKLVMASTAGDPDGPFYEACEREPSMYARMKITADDLPRWLMKPGWKEEMRMEFGEDSAEYQQKVMSRFAADKKDQVIPTAWLEASVDRWCKLNSMNLLKDGEPKIVGADIGGSGTDPDSSIFAPRVGSSIHKLIEKIGSTTMAVAGELKGMVDSGEFDSITIDANQIGDGVYRRLEEQGIRACGYVGSRGVKATSMSGRYKFSNSRSYAMWNLREMLDPTQPDPINLPPDLKLKAELIAPTYKILSGGIIQVEPKDKVKERLKRSPDRADAVMLACADQDVLDESSGKKFDADAITIGEVAIAQGGRERW
jgi:hypothetical protein